MQPYYHITNYKSKDIYKNWTTGGPVGTVYDSSSSGWFDEALFKKWFFQVFIPQDGTKVLVGDNLGFHFSIEVIEACEEHEISFCTFPPNSTHLCQPLDVAVFCPAKKVWQEILDS